ncbi:SufE family protein [Treponema parvum]|uniref:SufE family protein n=1 Tax=Treponema parvum TaxID=138851 RepID=A0A975F2L0_9SPIR|nr:SufE family protein [Treponema parvum]QTQ13369.1 SufE family protein [Treponema parvum]
MDTMDEAAAKAIKGFHAFEDSFGRYDYLMHIALSKPKEKSVDLHDDRNLIQGCQSKLWVRCGLKNNRLTIEYDSESLIILGFARIIAEVCAGRTTEEIASFDFATFKKIENDNELLSKERRNGLNGMIERIRKV